MKYDNEVELRRLSKEQVAEIFQTHMVKDFPPDELKPLKMMHEAMDRGIYECFGLYEGTVLSGYTYLIKQQKDYLVDYIAIFPDRRNDGLGGRLLQLLGEYLKDADSIIGEVENPDYAKEEADRRIQDRRYHFYLRNGLIDTGVRVTCFGVPFIILEFGGSHEPEEVRRLYKLHYQAILPKEMYEKNIVV